MGNSSSPAMLAIQPRPKAINDISTSERRRSRYQLTAASPLDREEIYRIRHEVYASELGQHPENEAGRLQDQLDSLNEYIVAKIEGKVVGFVSLTPPHKGTYSIDKYFKREMIPLTFDKGLWEIRLLTVLETHRHRDLSFLLGFAAFRWVESHGGTHAVGIGRRELAELYQRMGFETLGHSVLSGSVTYDLMQAPVARIAEQMVSHSEILDRIERRTDWKLAFSLKKPLPCFHGGAFFDAVGDTFETLDRRKSVINADVLDAWFPPAPEVVSALTDDLPWLLRTSPPTDCGGLVRTIAQHRRLSEENILPGAGSSDLIFRAFRHWLTPASRVLLLDPTYGEYHHVLNEVIGCRVDRFPLSADDHFQVPLEQLEISLAKSYDLVVLVNPNSPTGQHISRSHLEQLLARAPSQTRVWVDETYVDYVGTNESLERMATSSENVIVCKSMSKVYALSGARAAYLCAGAHQLEALRVITPPWVVSLPAQVAAVRALENAPYYRARYAETKVLRKELSIALSELGWKIIPGIANFLLCQLPENSLGAAELVARCRRKNLYLRDPGSMGTSLSENRWVRIAVKDKPTNQRMIDILKSASL